MTTNGVERSYCCTYCNRHIRPPNSYQRDGWNYPHGSESDVAEQITERLAVLPDGVFLRLNPPEQPSVPDVLPPGTLVRTSYSGQIRKVFRVRERDYYGVPAYTIAIGAPSAEARDDGLPKNYRGGNISELVYQDGAVRKLFWNNDSVVEPVGHEELEVDYQSSIATYATDGGVKQTTEVDRHE